jgi:hypothetical protein
LDGYEIACLAKTCPRLRDVRCSRTRRRVEWVLVTFEANGAVDHAQALADIHLGKAAADVHAHTTHETTKEWEAAAIDVVDKARLRARELKKSQPGPEEPAPKKSKSRSRSS